MRQTGAHREQRVMDASIYALEPRVIKYAGFATFCECRSETFTKPWFVR
jgi:hypothetical protein